MADVGLNQMVTTTGRARSKKLKDNVTDNHPVLAAIKAEDGIRRESGGRTIVEEMSYAQNTSVSWVGESGNVSLADSPVLDAAEFEWKYQLGSVVWTMAEKLKNSGGGEIKFIDLVASKFKVLEASMENAFHASVLSNGTGSSGLEMGGLALLVSKTPTSGTVGGIDRSQSAAAFYRNYKFNTATDWADGPITAANVKRGYDKVINNTTRGSDMANMAIAGNTHWEAFTQATQAIQQIVNENGTGKVGFQKLMYRGVPIYFGGGISFSGNSLVQDDLTYFLNTKPGYLNLVFHEKGEFELLEPVNSRDQAAVSRLMFTMANLVLGFAKGQGVIYDT